MADISMCRNFACAARRECYRFMAVPNDHWQSFDSYAPGDSGRCTSYVPVEAGHRLNPLIDALETRSHA